MAEGPSNHACLPRLVFGTLYPAYSSYKAVKTKNVKEYVSVCPFSSHPTHMAEIGEGSGSYYKGGDCTNATGTNETLVQRRFLCVPFPLPRRDPQAKVRSCVFPSPLNAQCSWQAEAPRAPANLALCPLR